MLTVPRIVSCGYHDNEDAFPSETNRRKAISERKPNHFVFKGVYIYFQKMKACKSKTD